MRSRRGIDKAADAHVGRLPAWVALLSAFFRLWGLLLLSYAAARLLVDFVLRGALDLRLVVGLEFCVVSLGQALVYRLVAGPAKGAKGEPKGT